MKRKINKLNWLVMLPTALAATLAIATVAHGQAIQTPLSAPVTVTGTSGGLQSAQIYTNNSFLIIHFLIRD